jgi:hypothetical protein
MLAGSGTGLAGSGTGGATSVKIWLVTTLTSELLLNESVICCARENAFARDVMILVVVLFPEAEPL